jgi:hypothetical protein
MHPPPRYPSRGTGSLGNFRVVSVPRRRNQIEGSEFLKSYKALRSLKK